MRIVTKHWAIGQFAPVQMDTAEIPWYTVAAVNVSIILNAQAIWVAEMAIASVHALELVVWTLIVPSEIMYQFVVAQEDTVAIHSAIVQEPIQVC